MAGFDEFCHKKKIIAEFARMHPFLENHKDVDTRYLTHANDVVYIDLEQTEDLIIYGFHKGCKSASKKADRELKVSWGWENLQGFNSTYDAAMERTIASPGYHFEPSFFEKLSQLGGASLCSTFRAGKYVAGAIFLTHGDYCHYFLSASEYPNAMNLILTRAIFAAKKASCRMFILGGGKFRGAESYDSLFYFKKSFSDATKPFYIYKKVHNQEVYDQICKEKGVKNHGYFPSYRSV